MNENLGINMSSYLEWNILLAVLALFGNFPYGPPLSPNGIWDSFVSLSVSLTHQQHKVVYTGGNFLCNGCIGKCVCGNWGLGKKFDSLWHTKAHSNRIGTHMLAAKAHAVTCTQHTHSNVAQLSFRWEMSGQQFVNTRGTRFCTQGTWEYLCHTTDNVFQSNPSRILHHKGFAALQWESEC